MGKLILGFIVLFYSSLYAQEIYNYPFKNPYVATLVSAANTTSSKKGFKTLSFEVRKDRENIPLLENRNKLVLTLFKQAKPAPLIFIIAGLGGGGNAGTSVFLAESYFKSGFNVVTLPNPFSWQYTLAVSESGLPGYLPYDAKEYYEFMTKVDAMLKAEQGMQVTSYAVVGYSFGANLAAFLMEEDSKQKTFDFQLALLINPPLDLEKSMADLDRFYSYGKSMSEKRREYIFGLLMNAVTNLWKNPGNKDQLMAVVDNISLTDEEIQWVIAQTYRESLQDVIFGGQQIHDRGLMKSPVSKFSQDARRAEIEKIGFSDYLNNFVYPQFADKGITSQDFIYLGNFNSLENIKNNSRIFVMQNEDDIFLDVKDIEYFKKTFGSRLFLYPYGGHLGNLWMKQNQADMLKILTLLLSP